MIPALIIPSFAAALIAFLLTRTSVSSASSTPAALLALRTRALALPAVGGAALTMVAWLFFRDSSQGFGGAPLALGGLPVWAVNLIYFLSMIVGMLCQAFFDAIKARKTGEPPTIDRWQLVAPLIISPMVFGGLYAQLPAAPAVKVLSLILCFQNGFFWQDLMASVTAKKPA